MSNEMRGKKNDAGKPDLSMIPAEAEVQQALGFMLGEAKYGRDNYRKGMEAHRLVAAARRHLKDWWKGEKFDPDPKAKELGLPCTHLGNAICCLSMLIELEESGALIDDRYKGEVKESSKDPVPLQEGYWQRDNNKQDIIYLKKNNKGQWESHSPWSDTDQIEWGTIYGQLRDPYQGTSYVTGAPRSNMFLTAFLGTEKPKELK